MAWFPNVGASLQRPANPAITFMTIQPVLSIALMLLKTSRGGADSFGQLHSFIYACLAYDQYASEWKQQFLPPNASQLQSWTGLATLPCLIDQDQKALRHLYHSRTIGKVILRLPVMSLDPQRAGRGAPRRLQGSAEADYESGLLTLGEFIEVAYMVRCNLLHGSYDIRDDSDAAIILMTGLRFTNLLRWMVQSTAW
jgi:hypothetical protein